MCWRIGRGLESSVGGEECTRLKQGVTATSEHFERTVTICASLAWHFYESNSLLEFRSAGVDTPLAPADELIFTILEHLAIAQPLPPDPDQKLMADLAASPNLFKIIVTSQRHGAVPPSLWSPSYALFLEVCCDEL